MGKPNLSRSQWRAIWLGVGIVLITLAVYGQVVHHDFIDFDDYEYITENPHVRTGLTLENIVWAFTSYHSHNWHPLTWISHMADVQLFGLVPAGHHLVNVAFHAVNSLLLMALLWRVTGALGPSAFVAALFALHPLHVESVAWAAERKDVLSCFFWLMTIGMYVRYVRRPGWKRYLPMVAVFALGLMAKQMLVTLPFVLLLLDFWPLGRWRPWLANESGGISFPMRGVRGQETAGTGVAAMAESGAGSHVVVTRAVREKKSDAAVSPSGKSLSPSREGASSPSPGKATEAKKGDDGKRGRKRTPPRGGEMKAGAGEAGRTGGTAPISFGRLVLEKTPFFILAGIAGAIVFAVQLKSGVLYGLPAFPLTVRIENALVSYVAYLGKTLWPVNLAVFYPHPLHALPLWKPLGAAGLLLAVSAAVLRLRKRHPYLPVGWFWYLGTLIPVIGLVQVGVQAMADRYTYIPSVGLFLMIAWGGWELIRWLYRISMDCVATTSPSPSIPRTGASEAADPGHPEGKTPGREKAKNGVRPPERPLTSPAHRPPSRWIAGGLALTALLPLSFLTWKQTGYWRDNATLYEHAARVVPDNYWAYNNLGAALAERGQREEAEALFAKSLAIMPGYPGANRNMAVARYKKGRYVEALPFLAKALEAQPRNPELHYTRGAVLLKLGRSAEAAAAFREALALRPADPDAAAGLREVSVTPSSPAHR
ncbi:MAG: tetratricopeptide repeat protein [Pseudomonadota bacterium]|nr:tetratricopeptide repeat protein [Pseudomonadota bacterium]